MEVLAEITFLNIPRPKYAYRYFGKGFWVRMDSEMFDDLPCALAFEQGKEYYDGDTATVIIGIDQEDDRSKAILDHMEFRLRVVNVVVAKGKVIIE